LRSHLLQPLAKQHATTHNKKKRAHATSFATCLTDAE
jgi:hypothetical protein